MSTTGVSTRKINVAWTRMEAMGVVRSDCILEYILVVESTGFTDVGMRQIEKPE
jgi:hypothetical protein